MKNKWFISDHHLGHGNAINWLDDEGIQLRPFSSGEEMDEYIVDKHNSVVKPGDSVYCLGDFAIPRQSIHMAQYLNGSLRLIRGNHDIYATKDYLKYFKQIYGVKVFSEHRMVCTHIPVHTYNLERWNINVHGHLHSNLITGLYAEKYVNVCVEQLDYTPIHIDEILARF